MPEAGKAYELTLEKPRFVDESGRLRADGSARVPERAAGMAHRSLLGRL